MTPSSRWTVVLVLVCALAVVGALGWASVHALRLEDRELRAQAESHLHENIRLALWRMDAAINSIVSRESARPYFQYAAFYPADRAYTSMWEEVKPGEVLVPSPLLDAEERFILLHFQRDQNGTITSPQAPAGNMRDLAEAMYVSSDRVISAQDRLDDLARVLVAEEKLAGKKLAIGAALGAGVAADQAASKPQAQAILNERGDYQANAPEQSYREFEARQQAAELARVPQQESQGRKNQAAAAPSPSVPSSVIGGRPGEPAEGPALGQDRDGATGRRMARDEEVVLKGEQDAFEGKEKAAPGKDGGFADSRAKAPADDLGRGPARPDVEQGGFAPSWVDGSSARPLLLLTRQVRVGSTQLEQGCWVDWVALRASLLESARDLLPTATVIPVFDGAPVRPDQLARRLAGISAELDPGPVNVPAAPNWTPMRTTLVVTWIAVLLALVAIAAVLHAAQELAERRGRFVSAVTHELRTPLTTFCLYSQMLADGMVSDESSRAEYLGTLKRESQRLARIVENVLEFARLGRRSPTQRAEHLTVPALLARASPALEQRAAQCGMVLLMEPLTPEVGEMTMCVEPLTVERILFNLVDNACKYAAESPDSRIQIGARVAKGAVEFIITDHGPGIEPGLRPFIFRPFQRGRSLAHASMPGMGLGLALSRGLARQLGGDLMLDGSAHSGSRFVLRLPAKGPAPA